MATDRGDGQKLIPIPASEKFIRELNLGFKAVGYSNRSQFIRDAIVEKLERKGIIIPAEFALPPDRLALGDKPNSKIAAAVEAYAKKGKPVSYSKKPRAKKSAGQSSPAPSTPPSV